MTEQDKEYKRVGELWCNKRSIHISEKSGFYWIPDTKLPTCIRSKLYGMDKIHSPKSKVYIVIGKAIEKVKEDIAYE